VDKQQLLIHVLEEDGIELIDKGNHYKLLCPFHDDNNPSCVVYKDSEYYQCYACGEKGDVFNYLWHARKMSYKQALQRYGVGHQIRAVIKRQPSLIEHIVSEEGQGVNVIAKYGASLINTLLIQELKELSNGKG
jgi:DNA primase